MGRLIVLEGLEITCAWFFRSIQDESMYGELKTSKKTVKT